MEFSGVISNIPLSSTWGQKRPPDLIASVYQSRFTLVCRIFRHLQLEATSTGLASVHHCHFTLNISKTPSSRAKHVSLKDNFLTELCNQNFEPTLTSGRLKTWIFWLLFNNKHQFLWIIEVTIITYYINLVQTAVINGRRIHYITSYFVF